MLATGRHTCSTSLAARRQKRAEILALETVPDSSKKQALMATAMLLLLQPFLVPCSSSTIPLSIVSSFNLLGFFKLFLPNNACPLSLLILLISILPDPYGSISSQSNFSHCFHHSLPLPLLSADGARKAGHLLSQTSCLPPSSTPLLGFPLLSPGSTQGRAELSQGEF